MTLTTSCAAEILRSDENANWSYEGARALVEYLEELEEDLGEEIKFCAVSLRCDYSQYESLEEWANEQFGEHLKNEFDLDGDYLPEELEGKIREYIQDHGTLIEFSGGIIVSSF